MYSGLTYGLKEARGAHDWVLPFFSLGLSYWFHISYFIFHISHFNFNSSYSRIWTSVIICYVWCRKTAQLREQSLGRPLHLHWMIPPMNRLCNVLSQEQLSPLLQIFSLGFSKSLFSSSCLFTASQCHSYTCLRRACKHFLFNFSCHYSWISCPRILSFCVLFLFVQI